MPFIGCRKGRIAGRGLDVGLIFFEDSAKDRHEEVIDNLRLNLSNECVGDTYHNHKGGLPT